MKGVSAIIAVILILMIVVALAALAYTWFTGIFTSLTTSATNATTSATTAMGMQIRIEAAKWYPGGWVNATIRNTGTSTVNNARLATYIGGSLCSTFTPNTGTTAPGGTVTLNISNATTSCGGNTPASPNIVLTITTESGMSDSRTIS
jgi:flagellin-like protein